MINSILTNTATYMKDYVQNKRKSKKVTICYIFHNEQRYQKYKNILLSLFKIRALILEQSSVLKLKITQEL